MDLGLRDRHVLVSGSSRGIGAAIVNAFNDEGARVSGVARTPSATAGITVDISSLDGVRKVIAAAQDVHGPIDVAVSCATANAETGTEPEYAASFQIDLMQAVRLVETLLATQPGHPFVLVAIASIHGMTGETPHHAYSVAKAALLAFVKNAAVTHAPRGIRVNAVCPGAIMIPGGYWDETRTGNPTYYEQTLRGIPSGRMGTPEEVAAVVCFLASERASWVNGATVTVDGGEFKAIR